MRNQLRLVSGMVAALLVMVASVTAVAAETRFSFQSEDELYDWLVPGDASLEDGKLVIDPPRGYTRAALLYGLEEADYTVEVVARIRSWVGDHAADGIWINLRSDEEWKGYKVVIGRGFAEVRNYFGAWDKLEVLARNDAFHAVPETEYPIRITVKGTEITLWVAGTEVLRAVDTTGKGPAWGSIALIAAGAVIEFDEVLIRTP